VYSIFNAILKLWYEIIMTAWKLFLFCNLKLFNNLCLAIVWLPIPIFGNISELAKLCVNNYLSLRVNFAIGRKSWNSLLIISFFFRLMKRLMKRLMRWQLMKRLMRWRLMKQLMNKIYQIQCYMYR